MEVHLQTCIEIVHNAAKRSPVNLPDSIFNDSRAALKILTREIIITSFIENTMAHWETLRAVTSETAAETAANFVCSITVSDDYNKQYQADLIKLFADKHVPDTECIKLARELQKSVQYVLQYIHLKRGPVLVMGIKGYPEGQKGYTSGFAGRVDLYTLSGPWRVPIGFTKKVDAPKPKGNAPKPE